MQLDPQTSALLRDIALGQLRHWLGIAGGALATYGALGADAASQTQFVTMASGIVMALGAAGVSWWEKTGRPAAQARLVEMIAAQEAKKQAAAKDYAAAQAAQQAIHAVVAQAPPVVAAAVIAPPAAAQPNPQPVVP